MRFTIQLRGETGRQLVKAPTCMPATISPFMISPHSPKSVKQIVTFQNGCLNLEHT